MLQQTRVEAVIPYYEKFLRRFPTVQRLAAARVEDVLTLWSGLGYYRRARALHSAAREMVDRFGGQFPMDYKDALSLPGIGKYTAGAVLSIAYEKPFPLLDGNVIRLLTRIFAIKKDPRETKTLHRLWELSEFLLPAKKVGEFNQALMELPALVCTPRSPHCLICPLAEHCEARKNGIQDRLPNLKKLNAPRFVELVFACIKRGQRFFLIRRKKSPLEGFWEFPSLECSGGLPSNEELGGRLEEGLGIKLLKPRIYGRVRHSIMDQKITAHYCVAEAGEKWPEKGRWLSLESFGKVPLTTLARKGMKVIAEHDAR